MNTLEITSETSPSIFETGIGAGVGKVSNVKDTTLKVRVLSDDESVIYLKENPTSDDDIYQDVSVPVDYDGTNIPLKWTKTIDQKKNLIDMMSAINENIKNGVSIDFTDPNSLQLSDPITSHGTIFEMYELSSGKIAIVYSNTYIDLLTFNADGATVVSYTNSNTSNIKGASVLPDDNILLFTDTTADIFNTSTLTFSVAHVPDAPGGTFGVFSLPPSDMVVMAVGNGYNRYTMGTSMTGLYSAGIYKYNTLTDTITQLGVLMNEELLEDNPRQYWGVKLIDGNIIMVPMFSTLYWYHINTSNDVVTAFTVSDFPSIGPKSKPILLPSGNLLLVIHNDALMVSAIFEFNPITHEIINRQDLVDQMIVGGILMPDGSIMFIPQAPSTPPVTPPTTTPVYVWRPNTDSTTLIELPTGGGSGSILGGVASGNKKSGSGGSNTYNIGHGTFMLQLSDGTRIMGRYY